MAGYSSASAVQACCDSPSLSRHRAPWYLADYCVPVSEVPGHQRLQSSRCHQLSVPRVRHSTLGTRAFFVAGPTVWNSLPDHLHDQAVDSEQFRPEIQNISALEVLCNRALQIDIYLVTYLTTVDEPHCGFMCTGQTC